MEYSLYPYDNNEFEKSTNLLLPPENFAGQPAIYL
jgi:hypothetical protein